MRLTKGLVGLVVVATGLTAGILLGTGTFQSANPRQAARSKFHPTVGTGRLPTALGRVNASGEAEGIDGAVNAAYDDQAYPAESIAAAQQIAAANAANAIGRLPGGKRTNWQELGPSGSPASADVVFESTAGTAPSIFAGRTTSIAISPDCHANDCKIFIGAAGGGVWEADNALAPQLNWHFSGKGIPSNAIGSIVFDPNDPKGKTLYVGTGEPNGSSDSEAGIGLYKSTDFGQTWTLVAGSTASTAPCATGTGLCPVATGRGIGAIAVDPADPNHIFIGTTVARRGSSSVNGGRFTPAGTSRVGLYESTDGGATFSLAFSQPSDVVDPASPTGGDFFRGGASDIELYRRADETQVYVALFDYGVYRRSAALDGDTAFHQVFLSQGNGAASLSPTFRTEFSLAPNGSNLRIYVGDGGADQAGLRARFYRVNNANVAAGTLFNVTNVGWTQLSNQTNGTPGFASYNYCSGQCSYDMPVYSPPGAPDIVYIGGAMQYGELDGRSNGRAVQRSEDAGVNFTDMTIDTRGVSRHPDQHVMAAAPQNPNILFNGDDGGVWRIDGTFGDVSRDCDDRGLSGVNLTECKSWLSKVPTRIDTLNQGLGTLQFQSLSVSAQDPTNEIMGGTQDNGTHAFSSKSNGNGKGNSNWHVAIFGDGGQSGISAFDPNKRFQTFFDAQIDQNFRGVNESTFNWVSDTFFDPALAGNEGRSFYLPVIFDPVVDGTLFAGLQHVWRTQDDNGGQAFLEQHCNVFVGPFDVQCGNWAALGPDLAGTSFGTDKTPGAAGYIVATERAASDRGTLWVGLRRGRVFVSSNADNANAANVTFIRIDSATTPTRFVSGIAVDPSNPNHAFISFSGYNAYATATTTATGHVFEVTYNPSNGKATWTNRDFNLGDQPVRDVALDSVTGDLFISTDFGVNMLRAGTNQWVPAGGSLPAVAVYGLTIDSSAGVLYAATHGRGAWKLDLR